MKSPWLVFVIGLMSFTTTGVYAIKPERDYRFTPAMRDLGSKEYKVKTIDHLQLNVWEYDILDSVKRQGTIILAGTDAGNMGYLIWQARAFVMQGFRVITFDYRGFGKSDDFSINPDMLYYLEFALDLDAVIRETRKKYPGDRLGVYALSMGTYISLLRKERIDYLVAEGFYNNPEKVAERLRQKGDTIYLPNKPKAIQRLKPPVPVLIFSALQDNITTAEDAQTFGHNNKAQVITFEGNHLSGMNAFRKDDFGDVYVRRVIQFLDQKR